MMMMMTFHNFAGYEFIFAFKQPDVTCVTSVYFRGAVKGKAKVKTTDVSRFFFRSNDCKPPPGEVADVGIFMMSLVLRCRNNRNMSCRKVAHVLGDIHDVIEWSVDTPYCLAILAVFSRINN